MADDWAKLDWRDGIIWMRAETPIERRYRVRACGKEPWTAEWVSALGSGDRLVNVGANVGSYALIAAHRGADVLCVEANPANAARLAENAAGNGLGARIMLVLGVCGPSEQAQPVALASQTAGTADIGVGEDGRHSIWLPGVTLDGLGELHGWPTHLLIDVDGGELDVLRGGAEALARASSVLIEISREQRLTDGCVQALNAAGLREADRWDTRGGQPIQGVWYGLFRRV